MSFRDFSTASSNLAAFYLRTDLNALYVEVDSHNVNNGVIAGELA